MTFFLSSDAIAVLRRCHSERSEEAVWVGGTNIVQRTTRPHRSLAPLGMTFFLSSDAIAVLQRHATRIDPGYRPHRGPERVVGRTAHDRTGDALFTHERGTLCVPDEWRIGDPDEEWKPLAVMHSPRTQQHPARHRLLGNIETFARRDIDSPLFTAVLHRFDSF